MIIKIGVLLTLFIIGEVLVNFTIFRYLKNYFKNRNPAEVKSGGLDKTRLFFRI